MLFSSSEAPDLQQHCHLLAVLPRPISASTIGELEPTLYVCLIASTLGRSRPADEVTTAGMASYGWYSSCNGAIRRMPLLRPKRGGQLWHIQGGELRPVQLRQLHQVGEANVLKRRRLV